MLTRTVCSLMLALPFISTAYAQDRQTSQQVLASMDFSKASIRVSNIRGSGAPTGPEIFKGFRLATITGCMVILRNEETNRSGKFVYQVTIPLADLNVESTITEEIILGKAKDLEDFGLVKVMFRTEDGRRSITLKGRARKPILIRGSVVAFGLDDRQEAERFSEHFGRAIRSCTDKQ